MHHVSCSTSGCAKNFLQVALNLTKTGMKSLNINLELSHDLLCLSNLTLHGIQLFLLDIVTFTFSGDHAKEVPTNDVQLFFDYIHPIFETAKWISTWIAIVHVEERTLRKKKRKTAESQAL